ncbi:hypothetical protein KVR01_009222 [Diaporthe batatas]|uniref:uncharacterized protein n=1 Tax=Diaporthe batatas TaxID=748121 RepID=UPI001D041FB7|nr:uncharacterized protein KVR01_009222 [Diaporthe batatas]KAG8160958.1 hypothetical protein KVR01_009222 [Diaporthe batatas]
MMNPTFFSIALLALGVCASPVAVRQTTTEPIVLGGGANSAIQITISQVQLGAAPPGAPPAAPPPGGVLPAVPPAGAPPAAAAGDANGLFSFTSTMPANATPEQVVNGTEPTGGLAGASGTFNFGLNGATDTICYNITLNNFQGDFSSPATTATHIHEAAVGQSGPPRMAFPNPVPVGDPAAGVRNSVGCMKGPFTTGVVMDGADTGNGFTVAQIEANPAAFFADTHSSLALPGAVRGQLA